VRNRAGTNPVTAAQAASTSTAVSRRTRRPPVRRGRKPQPKCRPSRPMRSPLHRHEHQNPKRTSPGRGPRLVASSRARGPHGRSAEVESRQRFRSQAFLLAPRLKRRRAILVRLVPRHAVAGARPVAVGGAARLASQIRESAGDQIIEAGSRGGTRRALAPESRAGVTTSSPREWITTRLSFQRRMHPQELRLMSRQPLTVARNALCSMSRPWTAQNFTELLDRLFPSVRSAAPFLYFLSCRWTMTIRGTGSAARVATIDSLRPEMRLSGCLRSAS